MFQIQALPRVLDVSKRRCPVLVFVCMFPNKACAPAMEAPSRTGAQPPFLQRPATWNVPLQQDKTWGCIALGPEAWDTPTCGGAWEQLQVRWSKDAKPPLGIRSLGTPLVRSQTCVLSTVIVSSKPNVEVLAFPLGFEFQSLSLKPVAGFTPLVLDHMLTECC